jgi:hypothetical protein
MRLQIRCDGESYKNFRTLKQLNEAMSCVRSKATRGRQFHLGNRPTASVLSCGVSGPQGKNWQGTCFINGGASFALEWAAGGALYDF